MATQQSATIHITNDTGGNARIFLFHNNASNGTQSGAWNAAPGAMAGPLTVHFETGFGSEAIRDLWSVLVQVQDGPAPGFYVSRGTDLEPFWKECQLQHADAGKTMTFSVSTSELRVSLDSGGCDPEPMRKLTPHAPVTHVFVLMLENHSFDSIFAMSGIAGITAATTSDSNAYGGTTYPVQSSAPVTMPTDPGHEFPDTVEQLCGAGATYPPGGPYPPIDKSGFAANYATSTSEGPVPPAEDIGNVMACFATPTQLPALHQLATEFALCDHWFSSMPGPTFPNRFFVHGASSSGLDGSPTNELIEKWEIPGDGLEYPNGSIFQALLRAGIPYRLYNDTSGFPNELSLYSDDPQNGSITGAIPITSGLKGVSLLDFESLRDFAADLQGPYPYPYTFIEPHYGNSAHGTYAGGSSHHPMDDVFGVQKLLGHVYAAIRNSPYWDTSLLIVVYDEHGGFYDSVAPGPAIAPGDNPNYGYNQYGFDFEQYGLRVPSMIVSPLVPAGTVDHTLYDHTSILATLERLFGLPPLTQRDAQANDVLGLLSLASPRTDCPAALDLPAPPLEASAPRMTAEEASRKDTEPVPASGLLAGQLAILKKTELELSAGTLPELAAIKSKLDAIVTRGHARAYAADVMARVGLVKEQRKAARKA